MAHILFVDDEPAARESYRTILEHYGHSVTVASSAPDALRLLAGPDDGTFDLAITDMRMGEHSGLDLLRAARSSHPELAIIVLTGHAELENAVEAMKLGATDYLTKETDYKEIMLVVEKALEKRALKREIERLRVQLGEKFSTTKIVGSSKPMKQLHEVLTRVAPTDSRVLITGESGTGKELVAETIHSSSPRRDMPFVAINCGAIAKDLQESELFGYVRGAFTGATRDKMGLLEAADRGTAFLDEIGEMTADTQVKLLRFLENGEFTPIGTTKSRRVNVRILAATNRDLREAIKQHQFREDLFYRLNVVAIHLLPLRDRRDDIPELANTFVARLSVKLASRVNSISAQAMEALCEYSWPGNIRELRNVIERAIIFATGTTIDIEHLPEEIFARGENRDGDDSRGGNEHPSIQSLDDVEKQYILSVLRETGGNKQLTARHLNIATTTLYRKLKQYGIE